VEAKAQRALDYEQNNIELAVIMVAELKESCLSAQPSLSNPTMPSTSGAFKSVEDDKSIQIDTEDLAKTVQIGAGLNAK
jgi:hypothetical protein